MTPARSWNVAAGELFFRYRNTLFPVAFALVFLVIRPQVMFGSPAADRLLVIAGACVALLGGAVRLMTIGFEYIDRGGKNGKVWASRLVQGGIYARVRNPMYAGNLLIALGVCMAAGSPAAYLVVFPFFVFVYQAIIAAEEAYLRGKFGAEYDAYCARVPSLIPNLRSAHSAPAGVRYHWKRAVRQDLSTMLGLLLGLGFLPVWRTFFLVGWKADELLLPYGAVYAAVVLTAYAILYWLKRQHKLQ